MSPPTAAAVSQLRHLIYYNLDNDLLQNALFLAGRLHGLDPRSLETTYLVAQCHLKLGHFRAAYDYAKDMRLRSSASANSASASALLGCAYVFAQACLALRRHSEGINALERCRNLWQGKNYWSRHSETERRPGPDAPAVCNLLGKLYKASGDEKKAAEHFAESLKGNPFMWDAFTDLSDAGLFCSWQRGLTVLIILQVYQYERRIFLSSQMICDDISSQCL
jgi:anaphase-promoting complex subunit 3